MLSFYDVTSLFFRLYLHTIWEVKRLLKMLNFDIVPVLLPHYDQQLPDNGFLWGTGHTTDQADGVLLPDWLKWHLFFIASCLRLGSCDILYIFVSKGWNVSPVSGSPVKLVQTQFFCSLIHPVKVRDSLLEQRCLTHATMTCILFVRVKLWGDLF